MTSRAVETTLLIPVLEADGALAGGQLGRDTRGARLPAHITVLYPFAPIAEIASRQSELSAAVESTPAFDFILDKIAWFGKEVVYLAPTPDQPFVQITRQVTTVFPNHKPYGGAFVDTIPHLCVAERASAVRMRWAARRARRLLPLRARAAEAWLMADPQDGSGWQRLEVFPLGTSDTHRGDASQG